jgi:hypothetical protein
VRRQRVRAAAPITMKAVDNPSASSPVGASTVTLASSIGESPLAGSKMWWWRRSDVNADA